MVLGNESAGILKYYAVNSDRGAVSIGLTPTTAINGTEIRVPPSQSVDSPQDLGRCSLKVILKLRLKQITQNGLGVYSTIF